MALGKTIVTPSGTAKFWIVNYAVRDTFAKTAFAQLRGYANKEDCDSDLASLEHYEYNIPKTVFDDFFGTDVLKESGVCDLGQFYKFIKQYDARFDGAEDLIY
jgi:hypothetical protein